MANQRITDFTKVNNFSGDGDLIPIIINTGTVPINAAITKANFIAAISLGSYVDVSTNQVVGGNKTFNGLVSLNGGVSFNLGSSTEFLKADGSVDPNTYLTLSDVPNIDGSQIGWTSDVAKTSLTLLNGTTGTLDYKVDRGRIILSGIITTDATTTGTKIIATLPVGARPSSERYGYYYEATGSISAPVVTIGTNGDVSVKDGVGSITAIIDKEMTIEY